MPKLASVVRWLRYGPPTLKVGAAIILVHLVIAVIGPIVAPHDPGEMGVGPRMTGASWDHPLGVDQLGRDVFSRVLHGSHVVIALAVAGTALGIVLGSIIGLLSAYFGGWIDEIIQRLVEALIAIPFIVMALLIIASVGPERAGNPAVIVFVIAFVYLPRVTRMARSAGLDIVSRDYMSAARLRGDPALTIVRREMAPNATGVLLVEFALRAGYAPVLVGALGFLGFGLRPPTPEWGLMMAENREMILIAPITVLGPGIALATLVIGLNLLTDGIARIVGRTAVAAP